MRYLYLLLAINFFQDGRGIRGLFNITIDNDFNFTNKELIRYIIKKHIALYYSEFASIFLYEEDNNVLINNGKYISSEISDECDLYFEDEDFDNSLDLDYHHSEIDTYFLTHSIEKFIENSCSFEFRNHKKNKVKDTLRLSSINYDCIFVFSIDLYYDDSYEYIIAFKANNNNFEQLYKKANEVLSCYKSHTLKEDFFVINTTTHKWNKLIIDI